MKRVKFGLAITLAMISLPIVQMVDVAQAETTEQIVLTTADGDFYYVYVSDDGDVLINGDPDDAITGNRGMGTSDEETIGDLPQLTDANGDLDLDLLQVLLGLLYMQ